MARKPIEVDALKHAEATRKNIPTAEFKSVMRQDEKEALKVAYERRNRDLDPQLIWRGKDVADWSDLVVAAPPLYIQEKVHPKVLIDDLIRQSSSRSKRSDPPASDLFADFNGLDLEAKTDFYQHDQHWSNRMIIGNSLSVMASLAEREGLRGQVQCIYLDPPYGIKFNSNFQWSTTSRDVKDGAKDQNTREPEQVRAFRDTWRDGIHSYLSYLRDRLTVARDLLSESGSIFVQIGDENVHRVRAVMDEVYGPDRCISSIWYKKNAFDASSELSNVFDNVLWYAKSDHPKIRHLFAIRTFENSDTQFFDSIQLENGIRRLLSAEEKNAQVSLPRGGEVFARNPLTSAGLSKTSSGTQWFNGTDYPCAPNSHWKTTPEGMARLLKADRFAAKGTRLRMVRFIRDNPIVPLANLWTDTGTGGFVGDEKVYTVQTDSRAIARCLLMTTDPGDLVLDPTCGSGTTAYVAEQWGRRWITIDTSRVAVALARSRLMGARYSYYLLADSLEGQRKEAEIALTPPRTSATHDDVRLGFVYERVPHITLKSIANNAEIDVIWAKWQATLEPLSEKLNGALGKQWQEWEIPRDVDSKWPPAARDLHAQWWEARIARRKEIDASIAAKAEFEYLFDKPYVDNSRIRVAGPFTVESLSPHRTLAVDWDDELIDTLEVAEDKRKFETVGRNEAIEDFAQMIFENLKVAGVQQAHKENRIHFTSLTGWPGSYICAVGEFMEGEKPKRAGVFVGPEFGTVSRPDLVAAAREARDAGFDLLIACAFNYDAHSAEFDKLGRVPVLKARMNPDLHMGADLKATGTGNLFVIFGEPDIRIETVADDQLRVKVFGVDVFKPQTGEVVSEGTDGIALWMLDDDYNEESFFVRHAYFLGANDPYKALKTTLKAEIDEEAWSSLYSDTSRSFAKPKSGRIAVKVINHLGDEVMKVFAV